MNPTYQKLFEPIQLANGVKLPHRYALSSIVTNSSTSEGRVTEEDLAYHRRRAHSAPLQISGAAYVEEFGQRFEYGFSVDHDKSIPGLKKLADAMKQEGAKAILQLVHSGRQAHQAIYDFGFSYGPSAMQLETPISHEVLPMTTRKIQHVVTQYGDATRRAIEAGFDGIEITGANRYLIQAFFSVFSNKRTDEYGPQNIENRSRIGLEIAQEVQSVIDQKAPEDFIFGYRISPEESAGSLVGYTIEEILEYVDHLLETADIDYLATAMWGEDGHKEIVRFGDYTGEYMNEVVYKHLAGRVPMMATGGVNTAEKAREALEFSDMIAVATPLLTDPEFFQKIKAGKENEINLALSDEDELEDLAIPQAAFKDIAYLMDVGQSLPQETRQRLKKLQGNYEERKAESSES